MSPGCTNCYAETWAKRHGHDVWGPAGTTPRRVLSDAYWQQPLKWAAKARKAGVRSKVFCSSMADVFEDHPTVASQRLRLWPLIAATADALDWLLLTKRPENVIAHEDGPMVPNDWLYEHVGFPRNVWIGASAENQEWYNRRLPYLRNIPAAVLFWSMEPLVGPIAIHVSDKASWVIVGGESGYNARPIHPRWVRSLRDQCEVLGIKFFMKQWGEWAESAMRMEYPNSTPHVFNDGTLMMRIGKKAAGRLLDGREWNEMPS